MHVCFTLHASMTARVPPTLTLWMMGDACVFKDGMMLATWSTASAPLNASATCFALHISPLTYVTLACFTTGSITSRTVTRYCRASFSSRSMMRPPTKPLPPVTTTTGPEGGEVAGKISNLTVGGGALLRLRRHRQTMGTKATRLARAAQANAFMIAHTKSTTCSTTGLVRLLLHATRRCIAFQGCSFKYHHGGSFRTSHVTCVAADEVTCDCDEGFDRVTSHESSLQYHHAGMHIAHRPRQASRRSTKK